MDIREFMVENRAYIVAPIGLSFGATGNAADCFFLSILGDKDAPIRSEGRIVGFVDEAVCRSALDFIAARLPDGVRAEYNFDFVCDISGALEAVTKTDTDKDAVILNCINTLLDLVGTSTFDLPDEYRILRAVADRFTFREELGEFTQVRTLLRNALLWCAGVVSVQLLFVDSLATFMFLFPTLIATNDK
jgi:hypothetical protein